MDSNFCEKGTLKINVELCNASWPYLIFVTINAGVKILLNVKKCESSTNNVFWVKILNLVFFGICVCLVSAEKGVSVNKMTNITMYEFLTICLANIFHFWCQFNLSGSDDPTSSLVIPPEGKTLWPPRKKKPISLLCSISLLSGLGKISTEMQMDNLVGQSNQLDWTVFRSERFDYFPTTYYDQ